MNEKREAVPGKSGKIVQSDEAEVHNLLDQKVRESVEETLNGLLDAEADELCGAKRYVRSPERVGYPGRALRTQAAHEGWRGDPAGAEVAELTVRDADY